MDCTIIESLERLPDSLRGCVLTVGNFDGVHLGHQRILTVGRGLSASADAILCVLTFDPAPVAVLAPDRTPERILPAEVKYRLLAEHGADVIVVVKTTREFLAGAAEDFVREVLVGRFRPGHLVEGPNFFFGHDRGGTVRTLQEMAGELGFEVTVVDPVRLDLPGLPPWHGHKPGRGRVRVSSSLVRDLIRAGDVDAAARCLGRPFVLYGRVMGGERRGRMLEFPTANLDPDGMIVPADGVYAAWTQIDSERYRSAVSVGTKPTFGSAPRTVEVHVLDAHGDFYEKPIAVTFLARLRDQRRFADSDSLRAQIEKDVQRVRELCR